MATPASDAMSSNLSVVNATITEDDSAFECEIADRITGRTQNVVRGLITLAGLYTQSGISIDIQRKTSRFPQYLLGTTYPRVVLQMDSTCTYYARVNHTTMKMFVYDGLGSELAQDSAAIDGLVFPFMAVGE